MKKSLLITFFSLIIVVTAYNQPCLPGGISFTTQAQIDSFPINYPNCTKIIGNVDIYGDDINNLDSLISVTSFDSWLTIRYNPTLNSLSGLSNVTSIGILDIAGDNDLTDLSGLENVDSLNRLIIFQTDILSSLNGLNNVSYIGGEIELRFNEVLKDLSALSNVGPTIHGITISDNDSLRNLSGLEGIKSVSGGVFIFNSYGINDLTGLDNLDSIGGGFWLVETSLTNISSLSSLAFVGEEGWIQRNYELTDLSGLENLTSIGGFLSIDDNDKITNLSELSNLESINGDLSISANEKLADISGIKNINAESILDLSIRWNPLLSACAVKSICDYLQNPNGDIDIENNNSGCNSQGEVEEDCLVGGFLHTFLDSKSLLYPNPANDRIFLSTRERPIIEVNIYNELGQKVLSVLQPSEIIDITSLHSGIYIVELKYSNKSFKEKIVIM